MRALRGVLATGAALLLVLVVGVVALLRREADGGADTGGVPERMLAMTRDQAFLTGSNDLRIFRNGVGFEVDSAIAALGDGRTFFLAGDWAGGGRCHSTVRRLEVDPGQTMTSDVVERTPGRVTELAVTRDARKIAYVARRDSGSGRCDDPALYVRDLADGSTRVWTAGAPGGDRPVLRGLAWSADGRHLTYLAHECCDPSVRVLDTDAAGDSFLAPPALGAWADDPEAGKPCGLAAPTYRGAELVAVKICFTGQPATAVVVDPVTGAVGRRLFGVPGEGPVTRVVFDAGGRHAYVLRGDSNTPVLVMRWDGGDDVRVVDVAGMDLRSVAW